MARDILKANTAVNDLHLSVFKAIARSDWQESPATTVDVALASRYFERFADHGVSVAQKVTYLVTGAWHPNSTTHRRPPDRSRGQPQTTAAGHLR